MEIDFIPLTSMRKIVQTQTFRIRPENFRELVESEDQPDDEDNTFDQFEPYDKGEDADRPREIEQDQDHIMLWSFEKVQDNNKSTQIKDLTWNRESRASVGLSDIRLISYI